MTSFITPPALTYRPAHASSASSGSGASSSPGSPGESSSGSPDSSRTRHPVTRPACAAFGRGDVRAGDRLADEVVQDADRFLGVGVGHESPQPERPFFDELASVPELYGVEAGVGKRAVANPERDAQDFDGVGAECDLTLPGFENFPPRSLRGYRRSGTSRSPGSRSGPGRRRSRAGRRDRADRQRGGGSISGRRCGPVEGYRGRGTSRYTGSCSGRWAASSSAGLVATGIVHGMLRAPILASPGGPRNARSRPARSAG